MKKRHQAGKKIAAWLMALSLCVTAVPAEQVVYAASEQNETEITERARKINRLESEADTIYRAIISDLFDGTHEAVEIIRWKEIMETMEETADQAERVGNLIKEVVMKYA